MRLVLGQGQLREPSGPELQALAPRVGREVPELEEEGVVVGEKALLLKGPVRTVGQFPWSWRDDRMVPGRRCGSALRPGIPASFCKSPEKTHF